MMFSFYCVMLFIYLSKTSLPPLNISPSPLLYIYNKNIKIMKSKILICVIALTFFSIARAQHDVFTIITRPVEDAYANPFGLPTTQCDDLSIPLQLLANLPDGHSGEWRIISGPRQDPPNQSEFAGFFGDTSISPVCV